MSFSDDLAAAGRLESELLRSFLAIAEAGSFSAGAGRIGRSQSAASLQIKRLETLLGQAVFERHARGVTLSPAGEKLRPLAQRVVDLLDGSIGELRTDSLEGAVRIGIPDEFGDTLLPQIVADFARRHPRVELAVTCGFSAGFPRALADDELDLAVHAAETVPPRATVLARERTFWVASRMHNTQEADPLPLALFDRACWWRDRALEALEAVGRDYRVVFSSESVRGVTAAIESGVAVGVLGEASLRSPLRVLSPEDGFPPVADSVLVLQSGRGAPAPAVQAMAESIAAAFARR